MMKDLCPLCKHKLPEHQHQCQVSIKIDKDKEQARIEKRDRILKSRKLK